jgi:hypothetical protein
MGLNIRPLNANDYQDILVDWWAQWEWVAPERDFLPDNGTGGMIVFDDEIPVCAGFIYMTNSKVAWVDWVISNKEYKGERKEAITMLVESLTNISKNCGSKYAYALIKNKSLVKTYEELGYIQAESYTSEMIKLL